MGSGFWVLGSGFWVSWYRGRDRRVKRKLAVSGMQRGAYALPFCCCGVKARHRTVERQLTVSLESGI